MSEKDNKAPDLLVAQSIRLPDILSKAKNTLKCEQTPATVAEVTDLETAHSVEAGLYGWELSMSPQWAHRSVANIEGFSEDVDEAEVWPGPIHVYKDVHVSSVPNNNRVGQLLCSSVVIELTCLAEANGVHAGPVVQTCKVESTDSC